MMKTLQPADWRAPSGYANGVVAQGEQIFLAGQIGWNAQCELVGTDLVDQVRQALLNVRTLLAEADAGPEHIVRMTWYLLDKQEYAERRREIGAVYRELIGSYTVAMSAFQVSGLIASGSKVEIEVTAVRQAPPAA